MSRQTLILTLEGITAGDYVTWVRDPEPPPSGETFVDHAARNPLGHTVEAVLEGGLAAAPEGGGADRGLPLTPEVHPGAGTRAGRARPDQRETVHGCVEASGHVRQCWDGGASRAGSA